MDKKRMRRCHNGKVRFNTLKDAQAAVSGLVHRKMKQGNPIVTFLRAYGCVCGGFHFGKTRDLNWDLVNRPPQILK